MIDTNEKLASILPVIETADWIAIDTEADSFYSYPEKICLIQITVQENNYLIDPLQKFNLAPLFKRIKSKRLIIHAADYDLRLLKKHYGFVPIEIFDTMFAARLLGYKEFGLADLVKKHFDVVLDKSHQRSNWTIRPIPPKMIEYAINDTRFLKSLESILFEKLKETNRLQWHKEICDELISIVKQNSDYDPEPWRIRGSNGLSPRALSVLRELWHWREQIAIEKNKPPFFILNHNTLIKIATAAADSGDFLSLIPNHYPQRRIDEIKELIGRGLNIPPEKQPQPHISEKPRLFSSDFILFNKIRKHRNRLADRLKIERSIIATQSELLELARNPNNAKTILMKWQYELLKEAINQ